MTAPEQTVAEQIAEVHYDSALRGKALYDVAKRDNDVGGDSDPNVTIMSAIVDLLHHAKDVAPEDDPLLILDIARNSYGSDITGEW